MKHTQRITEVSPSKSGKSYRVKIAGDWYGAKMDTGVEQMVGKVVEFESQETEKFGPWLISCKVIEGAPAAPGTPAALLTPPSAPSTYNDRYWLPFVSNQVAHAFEAGLIKNYSDMKAWTKQAHTALMDVEKPNLSNDDDISF